MENKWGAPQVLTHSGIPSEHSHNAPTSALAPHLSIVVLPFANLSGEPEQDYFIDGVTESCKIQLEPYGYSSRGTFRIAAGPKP